MVAPRPDQCDFSNDFVAEVIDAVNTSSISMAVAFRERLAAVSGHNATWSPAGPV